jgi:hypothetical protein
VNSEARARVRISAGFLASGAGRARGAAAIDPFLGDRLLQRGRQEAIAAGFVLPTAFVDRLRPGRASVAQHDHQGASLSSDFGMQIGTGVRGRRSRDRSQHSKPSTGRLRMLEQAPAPAAPARVTRAPATQRRTQAMVALSWRAQFGTVPGLPRGFPCGTLGYPAAAECPGLLPGEPVERFAVHDDETAVRPVVHMHLTGGDIEPPATQ